MPATADYAINERARRNLTFEPGGCCINEGEGNIFVRTDIPLGMHVMQFGGGSVVLAPEIGTEDCSPPPPTPGNPNPPVFPFQPLFPTDEGDGIRWIYNDALETGTSGFVFTQKVDGATVQNSDPPPLGFGPFPPMQWYYVKEIRIEHSNGVIHYRRDVRGVMRPTLDHSCRQCVALSVLICATVRAIPPGTAGTITVSGVERTQACGDFPGDCDCCKLLEQMGDIVFEIPAAAGWRPCGSTIAATLAAIEEGGDDCPALGISGNIRGSLLCQRLVEDGSPGITATISGGMDIRPGASGTGSIAGSWESRDLSQDASQPWSSSFTLVQRGEDHRIQHPFQLVCLGPTELTVEI